MSVRNVNVKIIMICRPSKEKKKKCFIFIRAMCVGYEIKVMKLQVLLHVLNFLTFKHNKQRTVLDIKCDDEWRNFQFCSEAVVCLFVRRLSHASRRIRISFIKSIARPKYRRRINTFHTTKAATCRLSVDSAPRRVPRKQALKP